MQDLNVTLVQTDPLWQDPVANHAHFDAILQNLARPTDLVVLPEMFTTGFSMSPGPVAQSMAGASVEWMQDWARRLGCVVTGSLIIEENGQYFNRLVWMPPDGQPACYDKRHLFRMAGEEKIYAAGDCRLTMTLKGWRVRAFVCYDLRFPIWTRNLNKAYDVALFVANWPARRAAHWKALLRARAIENQTFVVGVNRVGRDGNGLDYSGDSAVIDPLGDTLFDAADHVVCQSLDLNYETLETWRREFPCWMDIDR